MLGTEGESSEIVGYCMVRRDQQGGEGGLSCLSRQEKGLSCSYVASQGHPSTPDQLRALWSSSGGVGAGSAQAPAPPLPSPFCPSWPTLLCNPFLWLDHLDGGTVQ